MPLRLACPMRNAQKSLAEQPEAGEVAQLLAQLQLAAGDANGERLV